VEKFILSSALEESGRPIFRFDASGLWTSECGITMERFAFA